MNFENLPIKSKLLILISIEGLVTLFLISAALISYEGFKFRQTTVAHISTIGRVIAANSSALLIYDDKKAAVEILASLRAEPDIDSACLYDREGRLYATYPATRSAANFPARAHAPGYDFSASYFELSEPVMQGAKQEGTLYVRTDLHSLYNRIGVYGAVVMMVALGAGLISLLISNRLQKRIAQPILDLTGTAKAVSARKDYTLRASKAGEDEIGELTGAFNQMLGQISEQDAKLREAHETLAQHAQDLEGRVESRTVQLTEKINELESFSYSISHDMRAPLRAMQGYAEILIEKHGPKVDAEARNFLDRIMRTSRRLDTLIQDILSYSRVSRLTLECRVVNLDKLVDDVLQQYPNFQPPKARIEVVRPLADVLAHEASLTQVVSNLIGNATKFVAPGQIPEIKLWAEKRSATVRLWIEDHGIGIADKDRARIFGIFERIHSEKLYEGTGIGLSIVKKAVEKMGGSLGVESELGKGSRFWIELPAA